MLPVRAFLVFLFISPSGESIVKHKHSIGFSFNHIMHVGNSVCWLYLLSFKSGSPNPLERPSSVWWYYSRTGNVKVNRRINVFWVVKILWVTKGEIFFAEVKITYKDLHTILYTHWYYILQDERQAFYTGFALKWFIIGDTVGIVLKLSLFCSWCVSYTVLYMCAYSNTWLAHCFLIKIRQCIW